MPFQASLFIEILERCNLIERLHADGLDLDLTRLSTYLMHVEAHYGTNAYHSRKHGADVLLGVYRFLAERTQPHSAAPSDSGAALPSAVPSGAQPPAQDGGAISNDGASAISPPRDPRDGSSDGAQDGADASSRAASPTDRASGWALSPLQTFAGLFAAAVHDFNHPGTNNSHEVKCDSTRALQYAIP